MPIKRANLKLKTAQSPTINPKDKNLYTRLDYDFMDKHSLTLDYTYNKSKHISGGIGQYHPLFDNYYHKIWDANPAFYTSANLSYNG